MASQSTIDATKNREVVPTAAHPPNVESVTDLAEICSWLGTYRERLRAAQPAFALTGALTPGRSARAQVVAVAAIVGVELFGQGERLNPFGSRRDLAPETVVDQRYQIISRIGSGGMVAIGRASKRP